MGMSMAPSIEGLHSLYLRWIRDNPWPLSCYEIVNAHGRGVLIIENVHISLYCYFLSQQLETTLVWFTIGKGFWINMKLVFIGPCSGSNMVLKTSTGTLDLLQSYWSVHGACLATSHSIDYALIGDRVWMRVKMKPWQCSCKVFHYLVYQGPRGFCQGGWGINRKVCPRHHKFSR